MSPILRRRMAWLALQLTPFGLYGWALVVATGAGYNGRIGPAFNGLACDWTIFYTALEAWRHGHLAQVYDQVWLGKAMQGAYKPWLANPEPFPAFHYPPTWLLIIAPFAGLSMIASFAVTQALGFAALIAALAKTYGQKLAKFGFFATTLLLAPATSNNVLSGQNATMVCALFVAGLSLLETQPFLAGALLGLASFKPQILLMAPFALLAARNWRAIAGGVTAALALALVSAIVLGPQAWVTWANLMLHPRHDVAYTGIEWGRLWDDSVYTCAKLLGAPKNIADLVQGAATLGAGALVYLSFRRPLANDQRLAVFLAASALAAPHVSPYDMMLVALAAIILVWRVIEDETQALRPVKLLLPLAAWLIPLYGPPRATPIGLITPLVIFGLIASVLLSAPAPARRMSAAAAAA
ncbi:MAG TPA: glycosyltransferase family 87 protein [Caulobacteraceae bacterium]|nr:glycosyltransferase family 87 protein [Caulobacteraceae bacterium]